MKPTAVSIFAGCGGLDLGFIKAGFEILMSVDFFADAVETYKNNIGNHIICEDITKIPDSEIPDNFDVLLGGFPCQGFSVANNKRSMEDKRNFLYLELLRILKTKQPKIFVAENVKGILSMENGRVIQMILDDFKEVGYNVTYKVMKASDYGVPQHRERVIIIGNRIGVENKYPEITHGESHLFSSLLSYINTKDVIGFLADEPLTPRPFFIGNHVVYNHVALSDVETTKRKHDVSKSDVYDYLIECKSKSKKTDKQIIDKFGKNSWFKPNGKNVIPSPAEWQKLKNFFKFDDKLDKLVMETISYPSKFKQMRVISKWDEPSNTIIAERPQIHPNKKRRLSVRECAIIQTFPDDFIFYGATSSMYKQVGNAVPVKMANQIALGIKSMLSIKEKFSL